MVSHHFLTERHLQAIWLEQKYFRNLKTSLGQPIIVLSPGIWNCEIGPDFRKAHLIIDGEELHGDVEIHLSDNSWKSHCHDLDPRYNKVIFHLSLWEPHHDSPITTQKGHRISKAHLEKYLSVPFKRITQLIDLDLYPYRRSSGSGTCSNATYNRLSTTKIEALLFSRALHRLQQKAQYLTLHITPPHLRLPAGIAIALGYKHNSSSFLKLFLKLAPHRNSSEQQLLTMAMGMCGFFEERYKQRWNASAYYCDLHTRWQKLSLYYDFRCELSLGHVRPYNHPLRRLAYLAAMLTDTSSEALEAKIQKHWQERWSSCHTHRHFTKLHQEFLNIIPSYQHSHWNHHFTFESQQRTETLPLVGTSLKKEIVINVVLPFLYQTIIARGKTSEIQCFYEFYKVLPAARNSKTRYLKGRFFGDNDKTKLLNKAALEQGAFQIHHDFCLHYEASCEKCPFTKVYRSFIKK